ncbi:hypothetical protein [Streptomyces sp. NBC_01358]|uniref:hypothetical protein n=1 Tax=Streptomyces sp. NBC_01358 TaxID=2903837 RepID=UPI002E338976|nr:hypothetical protein [Streptomyces sp. NBC_01358]
MSKKNREDEILRRTWFRILSWVFTVGFGLVAVGLLVSLSHNLEGGPLPGAAACLFMIALSRRVMGSHIRLGSSFVTVINPLVTYSVPYDAVAEVRGGGGGTLNLITRTGDAIYSTGFGGSIIDNFVGSADRAVARIEKQVGRGRRGAKGAQVTKGFTVSWVADVCAVGAMVCAVAAGILGI